MSEPLIEVRNLTKHFPITRGVIFQKQVGAVKAVDGISFDVLQGETLGIVGETGCGKSTTARLLVRLLDPTSGVIRFQGNDIAQRKGDALKALPPSGVANNISLLRASYPTDASRAQRALDPLAAGPRYLRHRAARARAARRAGTNARSP